jgi:hypothetical protein
MTALVIRRRTVIARAVVDGPVDIDDLGSRPLVTLRGERGSGRAADGAADDRAIAPAQFGTDGCSQRPAERAAQDRIAPGTRQRRRWRPKRHGQQQ